MPFLFGHTPWNKGNRNKDIEKRKIWSYKYERTKKYREWQRNHYKKLRIELLEQVGRAKCKNCGFQDIRALQIDHIKGGGRKDIKILCHSKKSMAIILNNKDKYQVLCANCNWIKRDENKECRKFE